MAPPRPLSTALLVLGFAVGIAALAHLHMVIATAVTVGTILLTLAWSYFDHLPRAWGLALGIGLLGYAVLGRGFAYFGLGPLYVGEFLLGAGVLVALTHGRAGPLLRQPLTWLLLVLMGWGMVRSAPYLGTYGLDTLRDAVLWGYGAFALIVGVLLPTPRGLRMVVSAFERAVPIALVSMPVGYLLVTLLGGALPTTPGSDVPLIQPKGGDIAVHLAGILAFVSLGVAKGWHRSPAEELEPETTSLVHATKPAATGHAGTNLWLVSVLWVVAWGITFTHRAAIVTVVAAGALLILLRPKSGWWRPAYVTIVLLLALATLDVSVDLRGTRELSVESLQIAAASLVGTVGSSAYDGPRRWRLEWWQDIVDYTVFGPYRWTGKGYGINLANADGYQVHYDDSLRSPHNAHMSVLARSGLPGLISWGAFHLGLLATLLVAYVARSREGRESWARLNAWLLVYLAAFHINASFDVYLEGPQGGIWFWTVTGVALASLAHQWGGRHEHGRPRT